MRRFFIVLLGLILLCGASQAESLLVITPLSLAHGQATVVQCDGQALLVDTGARSDTAALLSYLLQLGIASVDCILITQPQASTLGGLDTLLGLYRPEVVMMLAAETDESCAQYAGMVLSRHQQAVAAPGSTLHLGSATIETAHPPSITIVHGTLRLILDGGATLRTDDSTPGHTAPAWLSDGSALHPLGIQQTDDVP